MVKRMTNKEAIAVLESDVEFMYSQDSPYCREAYRMAIEALKAELNSCEYWDSESHFCSLRRPQADPVKHGKWINISISANGDESSAECDLCGAIIHNNFSSAINYCPNCGAKMDGEEK